MTQPSEFTCGACGTHIVDATFTSMLIRSHPTVCPGFATTAENVCECGHIHVAGDEGADEGCSICRCQHWTKLCSRCHLEGLDACGDGRGYPECMDEAATSARPPLAAPKNTPESPAGVPE